METERSSGISNATSVDRAQDSAQGSQLAAASDARIDAARTAMRDAAITPSPQVQQAQFSPTPATPDAAQLAHTSTPLPPEPSAQELAAMAADVYAPGTALPAGWDLATPGQLAEIGLTESMLSSPTSDFRAEVYVREFDGQMSYTVAFRGTQSANDWGSNLGQGVGLQTDHYNRALEIGQRLTVPDGARVTLTGHSLGGGLASAASIASELDAATFNAAGLSDNTIADAEAIASADGQLDVPDISAFYVRGEILSALQDGGDRVFGALVGGLVGAAVTDLPEAVGDRIALDPVRPDDMRWYQDNPVAKHGMDYVISSLQSN